MAVLEKIRGYAVLLVIVIGGALLAFLFGDFFQGCSALKQDKQMNAFTVNGKSVKIQEYDGRVQQIAEAYRAQGQESLSEADMQMLRNQVYGGMVAEQILKEEANKIGIRVTPEETWDLTQGQHISPVILNDPAFRNPETGVFDRLGLVNFLKQINSSSNLPAEQQVQIEQARTYWANIEKNVRDTRLNEKYSQLVAKAVVANKQEVEMLTKAENLVADVAYVQQRASDATDVTIEVSEADLKAYYDEHQSYFRTDDGVQVDIVYASIRPTEKDYSDTRADIEAAQAELQQGIDPAIVLNEYSDASYVDMFVTKSDFNQQYFPAEFLAFIDNATPGDVSEIFDANDTYSVAKLIAKKRAPETRLVRHIVLMPDGTMEGQVNTDSLLTALQANPSAFAVAAQEHSLDRNSSDAGGEIGWLSEARATQYIDADFSNAVFSAILGQPFKYTSNYGVHLILVENEGEVVDKYKVAFANRKVVPSSETQATIYTAMSDFLSAKAKEELLVDAALNAGFQVRSNRFVSGSQPQLEQDITDSRQLIHWAMSQKPGAISEITECGDKYVLIQVDEKIPAGFMPLSLVADNIKSVVETEKKVDVLYDQLKSKGYTDLPAFASAINSTVDTLYTVKYSSSRLSDIGSIPAINAVATFAPIGTAIPVKGDNAVYLASVVNRMPDSSTATESDTKLRINANRQGYIRGQILNEMINKAKIEDRRYTFQ